MIDVALLGTGGMMPLPNRFLTALLTRVDGRLLLIDCGEGTQVTLKMLGWGFKNIDIICLTHFHADHTTGLPGLLLTIGASNRTEPLTIIGPPEVEKVVKSLCVVAPEIQYEINFVELPYAGTKEEYITVEGTDYYIKALPVDHSSVCFAYSIEEKRKGKFNLAKAEGLGLPKKFWSVLQQGETVEYEGKIYLPEMVLGDERKGIKVTYCTDSRPIESLIDFAKDSDLFICEGMYGGNEREEKAAAYKHMTFFEAAELAKKAEVKELWLTHFSPVLSEPHLFVDETRQIFPNTIVGEDRMVTKIEFENN